MNHLSPEGLERFLLALPKVENHLHLDGALSPETVKALAEDTPGSPLKGLSIEEIRERVVVAKPREALPEVLAAFDAFYPLLKTPQAVELAAYEAAREAGRQGVIYHELRFAPVLQAAEGFTSRDALYAALRGAERGRRDFKVGYGFIVCLLRPLHMISREKNEEMTGLAVELAGKGVTGLDVADVGPGDEALSSYARWLGAGRAAGLGLTAHAGETTRGRELEDALDIKVNRIGHAVALRGRDDLMRRVKDQGVTLEANLTSNLRTGAIKSYQDHPIKDWMDRGLKVSLSTDDPGVFGVDLIHEYRVLNKELGFSPHRLVQVAREGLESLFLTGSERAELTREFDKRAARALRPL